MGLTREDFSADDLADYDDDELALMDSGTPLPDALRNDDGLLVSPSHVIFSGGKVMTVTTVDADDQTGAAS